MTLEELQLVLGGVLWTEDERRWLETRIGGLRAGVAVLPNESEALEVAVETPGSERPADEPLFLANLPRATGTDMQPRLPPPNRGKLLGNSAAAERARGIRRFRRLVLFLVALWMLIAWLRSGRDVLMHPRIG